MSSPDRMFALTMNTEWNLPLPLLTHWITPVWNLASSGRLFGFESQKIVSQTCVLLQGVPHPSPPLSLPAMGRGIAAGISLKVPRAAPSLV